MKKYLIMLLITTSVSAFAFTKDEVSLITQTAFNEMNKSWEVVTISSVDNPNYWLVNNLYLKPVSYFSKKLKASLNEVHFYDDERNLVSCYVLLNGIVDEEKITLDLYMCNGPYQYAITKPAYVLKENFSDILAK